MIKVHYKYKKLDKAMKNSSTAKATPTQNHHSLEDH